MGQSGRDNAKKRYIVYYDEKPTRLLSYAPKGIKKAPFAFFPWQP